MCGISGFILRDPSFKVDRDALLTSLLDEIETRGTHATGFVAVGDEGTLEWQKAACKASVFNANRRVVPRETQAALGHTRFATQGLPSFMENNHPIKRGPFYIIHNGHVSNDTRLFINSERTPFGEVDSEAIAARLSAYGDLKFLGQVVGEIEGDAAVAALDERDPTRLALARGHSSPLWVYNGKRIVVFASTRFAVERTYEKHIGRIGKERLIEVKEGQMLTWKGGSEFWRNDFDLTERYSTAHWSSDDGWASGYSHGRRTNYSGNYSSTGWAPGKVWDSTQKRYVEDKTPGEEKLEKAAGELVKASDTSEYRTPDYDFVGCDGCDEVVTYLEVEYIYDHKSGTTLLFCDKCWETLHDDDDDDEDLEIIDADAIIVAADDEDPDAYNGYDDYAGANAAIIRTSSQDTESLIDRLAKGIFFRGM